MGLVPKTDNVALNNTLDAIKQQNEILIRQLELQEKQIENAKSNLNISILFSCIALVSSIGILIINLYNTFKEVQ
ncbi:hypothetical protein [Aquimarina sp. LLG6339-5]|uniref:hypothetical protein n=1 Tax=Aquimarina sp. LLG6339-5 TaxID=3160830 RepID=UPI00386E4E04